MAELGWTQEEMDRTPALVLYRLSCYLAVRGVIQHGGTLSFDNSE